MSAFAGCEAWHPSPAGRDEWVRTELFFGLTRPGGAEVTAAEFQAFLDKSVTPRFPDGFTVVQAQGHYRGDDHVHYDEPSRILVVFHRRGGGGADAGIDAIAREYVRTFDQESVLRSDADARVRLIRRTPAAQPDAPATVPTQRSR